MPLAYVPGQRWISDTEPELGLGAVSEVSRLTVTLSFGASGETREYARDNAPLRRVRFHVGDTVKDRTGRAIEIKSVDEREGLIHYRGPNGEFCETELADAISFSKPEERLLIGQVDAPETFALRLEALHHQHRLRKSLVRGFVGGRIDLLPHQIYIAAEVSRRLNPRVLLADEVGLGKTIEACLILHRLILTGRARRVLILTPDSLVHQWLLEMLRRFNIWLHVFDEARCKAIEASRPEANPFADDQLIVASERLFTSNPRRQEQAIEAGWDVLVVDEAHHLKWTAESVSPEYQAIEALSRGASGLLLLTATPEQLGMASHFARLRLLDPARFHDMQEFLRETENYQRVAKQAGGLTDRAAIDDLLDRHGTGRVMFRNTRATVKGFPRRNARLAPLEAPEAVPTLLGELSEEFLADTSNSSAPYSPKHLTSDPRLSFVVTLLRDLAPEKVLLICRSREKAEAIEATLRERLSVKAAMFHEGLSLVQRDRQAAWFAEEDGARLLVCSEIGSEGRNFQFARHLVMFDLPTEPELLEQRIGRLDRIGQRADIELHIPFVKGSAQEVLVHWYHTGLNAFEKNLHGGHALREEFGSRVLELAERFPTMERAAAQAALLKLASETAVAREALALRLEEGRDRLLELNSFRPESASSLVDEIRVRDQDTTLDEFMMSVFDHFAIPVIGLGPRTFRLGSAGVLADTFPGLPLSGLALTCERSVALSREDLQFLTWDHPLVTGALDVILGSERGNSSFAWWPDTKVQAFYLETVHVLECVAPPHLHLDRFLPTTPLRTVLDHRGEEVSGVVRTEVLREVLQRGDASVLGTKRVREDLLPELLLASGRLAQSRVPPLIALARFDMTSRMDLEITRLRDLQKVNPSIRPEEIAQLVEQKAALEQHIDGARLRLDAIRVIQRGPA